MDYPSIRQAQLLQQVMKLHAEVVRCKRERGGEMAPMQEASR